MPLAHAHDRGLRKEQVFHSSIIKPRNVMDVFQKPQDVTSHTAIHNLKHLSNSFLNFTGTST
jgi:hypothetical protein